MTTPRRHIPEYGIIAALLGVFLVIALLAEQAGQSVVTSTSASSLNANPAGSKALYALLETIPLPARRLTSPWYDLHSSDGMVVIVEKFDKKRQPDQNEINALRNWTQAGGTTLYFLSEPARPLDPQNTLAGDIEVTDARPTHNQVPPAASALPYTRNVGNITVASPVRLQPASDAHYDTLFADDQGIIAVHKQLGKGHVILVADTAMVSNKGINEADNVVFLANIASAAVNGTDKTIAFDEYHHGVGFDIANAAQQNWISTLPRPVKLAAWPFILLLLLIVYNGNRRFGIARPLPLVPYRSSEEYVHSLARWYQRAEATDLVIQTLYQDFRASLTRVLDVAPDLPTPELIQRVAQRFPQQAGELSRLIQQCDQMAAGQRIPAQDMLALAQQLHKYKNMPELG